MLNRRSSFKKTALLVALAGALGSQSVHAANWLMLQGTEADHQAPRANVWGFAQIDYHHTADTKLTAGPGKGEKAAFNQMKPQLTSASGFNIRRARIGVRGANLPLDNKVNYFIMAELGNNGITTGGNGSQGQLVDASVTLNHIPGARVRVGLFKNAGSEEAFKAIPVFNYVSFTEGTDRLILERKIDDKNTVVPAGQRSSDTLYGTRTDAVNAVRDTGIQVFDAFRVGDWEHSYAIKLGNGNGLAMTDNDENKDLYLYASTEKLFGDTTGPRRHGMKFYAWSQTGKRTIAMAGNDKNKKEFNRERKGLGMTYFDGKYRMAAEYFTADGMIWGGPHAAVATNVKDALRMYTDQEADAYQLDFGYRIKPNIELNARYDVLNSATKDEGGVNGKDKHRIYTTTTLGAQYFFNRKTSVRLNYEFRDLEAPDVPSNSNAAKIVKSIDDRVSAQLMMIF